MAARPSSPRPAAPRSDDRLFNDKALRAAGRNLTRLEDGGRSFRRAVFPTGWLAVAHGYFVGVLGVEVALHLVLVVDGDRLTQRGDADLDDAVAYEPHKPDRLRRLSIDPLFVMPVR